MRRTSPVDPPSGTKWALLVHALGGRKVPRYASTVRYARRGRVSALSRHTGGGQRAVLSEWSDWRTWPADRDAELDELQTRALRLLQRAIVAGDPETIDILLPFVRAANYRSERTSASAS